MKLRTDSLLREVAGNRVSGPAYLKRFRQQAICLIRHDNLVEAAFCSRIVRLERDPSEFLHADGEVVHAPQLLPAMGKLTALACGVATIGPRLEQRVRSLFANRQRSLAMALDLLGNELLLAVTHRLHGSLEVTATRLGLALSGELRPGDPGLELSAHAPLLRLALAHQIGVRLTSSCALQPLKSISLILGAGTGLGPAAWSRCDDCRSRDGCALANTSNAPALA